MGMSINDFNQYVREMKGAPKWQTTSPNRPGNFPQPGLGGREPVEYQRSGGSSVPSSGRSVNSSASTSLSTIVEQLSDGKIIDLSPSEWTRVSERARGISPSTLLRLANAILRMAGRRMLPFQLIEIAMRIIDEYYRRRDGKKETGPGRSGATGGYQVDPGWEILAQCPSEPPVYQWQQYQGLPGAYTSPHVAFCNSCTGGQNITQQAIGTPILYYNGSVLYGGALSNQRNRYSLFIARIKPASAADNFQPNLRLGLGFPSGELAIPDPIPVKYAGRAADDWPQSREVGDGSDLVDDMSNEVTTWDMSPPKGPPNKTVVDVPFPDRLPPPPYVKEKKIALALAGTARRIVDWTTEARDFVNSLWEAIPTKGPAARSRKYWKPGYKQAWSVKLPEKMWQIWKYWDYLGRSGGWNGKEGRQYLSKAFANVFADNVKDFVYGRIGRTAGRASARLGRPVGVQTGPVF